MYFQLFFALDRVKALAPQHPEWKDKEPFASLLKGDVQGALAGGEHAIARDRHGHARRHDHRGVRADRQRLDRHREAPQDRAALHRDGLSADARAARLPARERLQDLHRLRRRHRVHAPVDGEGLRHPARAGHRQQHQDEVRDARRQARARAPAGDRTSSTTRPASRSASTSTSAAARSPPSATPTATSRCCSGRPPAAARASGLSSTTPTPSASGPTTANPASAASTRRSTRRKAKGWTVVSMKDDWKRIYPD